MKHLVSPEASKFYKTFGVKANIGSSKNVNINWHRCICRITTLDILCQEI